MFLTTWQLAQIQLTTSYAWLVLLFALRGLGLGCLVQTLTVAALSRVQPRQFTQASSLNTVIRFVFTSLGIAVLATLVQSRAAAHLRTLAELARPNSPAAFEALSQQALNLAVQDAFWLTPGTFLPAFLVMFFIRVPSPVPVAPARAVESTAPQGGEANRKRSDEKAGLSR